MVRNLLLALLVIAGLLGGLVLVARRAEHSTTPPTAHEPASTAAPVTVAQASGALMPAGYEGVSLGMSIEGVRRVRRAVHRDPGLPRRDDGLEVWEEDDPSGARVLYLVDSQTRQLTQVQFASRLASAEGLRGHFEAMQQRYGVPTGIWDCPERAEASPMRRFTWRREGASVMEAVLLHSGGVALTMVIASNDDVIRALSRSRCRSVRGREAVGVLPEVEAPRGEQIPFIRPVQRR